MGLQTHRRFFDSGNRNPGSLARPWEFVIERTSWYPAVRGDLIEHLHWSILNYPPTAHGRNLVLSKFPGDVPDGAHFIIPRVSLETQGFCFLNQKNVCVSVAPTETIPTNQTTKTNHLTIAIGLTIIANQVILFHSEIEWNFMRRN